jgi:hypothetical protein
VARWIGRSGILSRSSLRLGDPGEFARRFRDLGRFIPFDRLPDLAPPPGSFNLSAPSLPGGDWSLPSLPESASGEGAGRLFLWIVLVAVTAVILWKGWAWQAQARRARKAAWQLGPWPVDPARVATRQDLVRAFEYLACLRLGVAALVRHHLDLAAGLGGGAGPRQAAADHLGRLYEQARYAPPEEPLPPADLGQARRELCLLAGVAVA